MAVVRKRRENGNVMNQWSFWSLLKYTGRCLSNLRTAQSIPRFFSSLFPSFPPAPLSCPLCGISFLISLFSNNNKKHQGGVDSAAAGPVIVLCPLRAAVDTERSTATMWWLLASSEGDASGFAWHRTCFSSPRGNKSRFVTLLSKKWPVPCPRSERSCWKSGSIWTSCCCLFRRHGARDGVAVQRT